MIFLILTQLLMLYPTMRRCLKLNYFWNVSNRKLTISREKRRYKMLC